MQKDDRDDAVTNAQLHADPWISGLQPQSGETICPCHVCCP